MNDSVEEMVRKVSARKRRIAAIAVDGGGSNKGGGGKGMNAREQREQERLYKMDEVMALFKGVK